MNRAEAALKGFDISYRDDDHHLLREEVDIDIDGIIANTVSVAVNYVLRDNSGNIDDAYRGVVEVLVIADVA
ncbi:MAG: hypothetical protein ACM3ZF_06610 [Mycobacterium leprae]